MDPRFKRPLPSPLCSAIELLAVALLGACRGWNEDTNFSNETQEHRDRYRLYLLTHSVCQIVETVNAQLTEQFHTDTNRAHTFCGLRPRPYTKLTSPRCACISMVRWATRTICKSTHYLYHYIMEMCRVFAESRPSVGHKEAIWQI
jgi:hypothetical protein